MSRPYGSTIACGFEVARYRKATGAGAAPGTCSTSCAAPLTKSPITPSGFTPLFWAPTCARLNPKDLAKDLGPIAIPAEPLDTSAPNEQQVAS